MWHGGIFLGVYSWGYILAPSTEHLPAACHLRVRDGEDVAVDVAVDVARA